MVEGEIVEHEQDADGSARDEAGKAVSPAMVAGWVECDRRRDDRQAEPGVVAHQCGQTRGNSRGDRTAAAGESRHQGREQEKPAGRLVAEDRPAVERQRGMEQDQERPRRRLPQPRQQHRADERDAQMNRQAREEPRADAPEDEERQQDQRAPRVPARDMAVANEDEVGEVRSTHGTSPSSTSSANPDASDEIDSARPDERLVDEADLVLDSR